ncbi:hypothetical protein E0Z10_g1235 [Xylaria hypoxylon]|uniref:Uncharacterized protein n=1 Tax=Xylaria hypoxylon TaxID=37992 RepID=A0A4Z0Z791_9PEZI|nr:hypothetical protein E0Z10_g1235 [Xylaria hypoxylon]
MLNYKGYHMAEVVSGGLPQIALFEEALRCKYLGAGKPYGKVEFDKWLADYYGMYLAKNKNLFRTYLSIILCREAFPLSEIRKFDSFIEGFCSLHVTFETVTYHGKTCKSEEGNELSKRDTLELAEKAKTIAPQDRLLVARLEDGFGWE